MKTLSQLRDEKNVIEKELVRVTLEFIAAPEYLRLAMKPTMQRLVKQNNRLSRQVEDARYALRVTPERELLVMEFADEVGAI